MASYVERYQAGEHQKVWNELTALGSRVFGEGVHADAMHVARETMRRARHNIELLIERLHARGYQFAAEAMIKSDRASVDQLEREIGGPLPLSLRAFYEEVGGVSLMGSHPLLNPASGGAGASRSAVTDILSHLQPMPRERAPGESLQAFYARLTGGFQMKASGQVRDEQALPDPLVVYSAEDLLDQVADQERASGDLTVELVIAPDDYHKSDISGDACYVALPDPHADFLFDDWHRATFVNYLRTVFEWGGFPGWERSQDPPQALLSELAAGLEQI